MRPALVSSLRCPACSGTLSLRDARLSEDRVESGELFCSACSASYPVVRFIPRFVPSENYAKGFGFQWNRFPDTQLDSRTGTTITRERFLRETAWEPDGLNGALVLDVGCGSGRFAEVAATLGATVIAVDYSDAVEACWKNLGRHPNVHVVQADMRHLPLPLASFDYVYCLGVIQHTPDPRRAFAALLERLKPGGRIAVDAYPKTWKMRMHPGSWLRPLTRRLDAPVLFRAVERVVPFLLALRRAIRRLPVVGEPLHRAVPVADYMGVLPLNDVQLRQWAVLDTFDWLSPRYQWLHSRQNLRSWLTAADLRDPEVLDMGLLVARGRKPASSRMGERRGA